MSTPRVIAVPCLRALRAAGLADVALTLIADAGSDGGTTAPAGD